MLSEVKTREVMTTRAAMEKYRTQYFIMIITETVDQGDNDLGYVIFVADKKKELPQICWDAYKDKRVGFLHGVAAEPYPLIGNVVHHDQN